MAAADDTIRRLRDLNGVLDFAVLLAVDVIREAKDHGLSRMEWQHLLIMKSVQQLSESGEWAGRFSLFSDDELRELRDAVVLSSMTDEIEFEFARRGLGGELLETNGSDQREESARAADGDGTSDGQRGARTGVDGGHG